MYPVSIDQDVRCMLHALSSRPSRHLRALAASGIALCLTFAFAPPARASAAQQATCTPQFPFEYGAPEGWLGADAAYSTPLTLDSSLWVFGDTIVGKQRQLQDKLLPMVRNSLAVSRCSREGVWSIRYLIQRDSAGRPTEFFRTSDPGYWYWPMDALHIDGKVLVSLLCLRQPREARASAFAFEACGVDLATIAADTDLLHAPVTREHLLPADAGASSVATMVLVNGTVYVYFVRASDKALVVARFSPSEISHALPSLEFLGPNDAWSHRKSIARAKAVMDAAPSEMSIRYYPRWSRWLAVYKDPELLSDRVLLRSAPSPVGPWDAPRELFSIRALDPAARRRGVFCYAGKDHPEFARAGELLITYACNAFDPAALVGHNDTYVPKVVRVQLDDALHVREVRRAP